MIRLVLIALLLAVPVEATEYFAGPSGSGSTCSSGSPCTIQTGLGKLTAGDTLTLQDGTYQGSSQMLNIAGFPDGTAGNVITVRALNEGSVFIDGQFTLTPFNANGNDYWTITGIDFGNAGDTASTDWVIQIGAATHLTMQRICGSNSKQGDSVSANGMVMGFYGVVTDSLFEDFCLFGTGRNILVEQSNGSNNVFRRFWMRFEGWCHDGRMNLQAPYYSDTTTPSGGTNVIYENFILVHDPEQQSVCSSSALSMEPMNARTPSLALTVAGMIMYGYSGFNSAATQVKASWYRDTDSASGCPVIGPGCPSLYAGARIRNIKDVFVDTRSQTSVTHGAFLLHCDSGLPFGSNCNSNSADRLTAIVNSGNDSSSFTWANLTNYANECTSLSSCPNFYTGDSPGTGSRACFEYSGGTLTSTKLWPWRMDNRIKAALARAFAAGTGGSALAGSAGSGYAANTVTSEIVSRYGSIPTECLTGSSFTPSFPVASDFPSVSVRDDFDRANAGTLGGGWTELLSDTFSIASNAAAAPTAAFARAVYSDTQLQTDHEVYATWTTIQQCCGAATILSFAGTDLTVNNQYRVRLDRQSGGNTLMDVQRIDSGGSTTTVISPTDLGIDIVDTNSFGVRVSGTTISVYWKWTDGIWYRIGQVTDANLPSSGGVYGGVAGSSPVTIDNFGAGPFVDQPVQEPPSPPSSSGIGRFGTTFPGVR